jgi:hypothetical protein
VSWYSRNRNRRNQCEGRALVARVALKIRLAGSDGDEVLVQGDGLVQPLPRLVQGIDPVSDTQTVSAVLLHSSA